MPRHYPAELRRQTCARMLVGEAVKDLSAELGIAGVTLYKWRRQALTDVGQRPGLKSYESDPLLAARRRVKELDRAQGGQGGSQFTSWAFTENVRRLGLISSMGTVGDCYDNAPMESFWVPCRSSC